jgi:hypothetical protein
MTDETETPVGYVANHGRSHMSARQEGLQIAWDATSMASLLKCPRYYQYTHLCGWRAESIHLDAGKYIASALERFQKARATGTPKEDAILDVMRWYMEASYEDEALGRWETQWHCTAEKPRKVMVDGKARYRKCPNALSGVWFPEPAPHICGECGAPTARERHFIAPSPSKNRLTIALALLEYMDSQASSSRTCIFPYNFPNGKPAVELSFSVPFPRVAPTGEAYTLNGHMDYIAQWGDEHYISDNKTTGKPLNDAFFSSYAPSIQFDTYDLVGTILWPELELDGVQVDALQLSASATASGRHTYYKTDEHREEQMRTIQWILECAEKYAADGYWPMNKGSCFMCPFREICARPPSDREYALEADPRFERREPWNPTITR